MVSFVLDPPSVEKEPPTDMPLFMAIALGVIGSAGFILLISLGLMYFYGVLCCVKRKTDNGNNTQPEGRMMDQGIYAEIQQEIDPSQPSQSTTSYYMDLQPIPRTNYADTTTSYYMDLKPIPGSDNDDFGSPNVTPKQFEAVYVNKDITYENALHNDPDNQDNVSPSSTGKCSSAVYVNTDEKATENDFGDPQHIITLPTA
ncbi:uncharacterized protein LOC105443302 [Strongylocentrotus purpuratus]|uniref:Uncharacterized protein n=1 Tax=Strongylocentrotus purpuratus TaxID=7668 RepID=A0A7M7NDN0_STRPU|nr:uncharacterized protein LOC105443302 [Strongylocentrotus purpuratus]